jgi:hypothetical protein
VGVTKKTHMKAKTLIPVLETAIEKNYNTMILGSPGIGKSEIVKQVIEKLGYELMICHPVCDDVVDYKGLPSKVSNTEASFLPYGNLLRMMQADKPLVIFFDDLGQSTALVQAALMQLILERSVNGQKVSPHVRFVAASNRKKDNSGVQNILSALISRFNTVVELQTDVESWKSWALKNSVPIELIAFINFRTNLLNNFEETEKVRKNEMSNFACPRTITNLGKWLKANIFEYEVWKGCVGEAFATEFKAFYDVYKSLAGLPEKVILHPQTAPVPQELNVLYALVGALAHKSTEKNINAIFEYVGRIPTEFQVFYIKDATAKNEKLMETDAYINWQLNNSHLLQ